MPSHFVTQSICVKIAITTGRRRDDYDVITYPPSMRSGAPSPHLPRGLAHVREVGGARAGVGRLARKVAQQNRPWGIT
jgi:hypothetical protein